MISHTLARWLLTATDAPLVQAPDVDIDGALARRNLERLAAAKEALGRHYLLHPSNQVRRVREARTHGATLTAVPNRGPESRAA